MMGDDDDVMMDDGPPAPLPILAAVPLPQMLSPPISAQAPHPQPPPPVVQEVRDLSRRSGLTWAQRSAMLELQRTAISTEPSVSESLERIKALAATYITGGRQAALVAARKATRLHPSTSIPTFEVDFSRIDRALQQQQQQQQQQGSESGDGVRGEEVENDTEVLAALVSGMKTVRLGSGGGGGVGSLDRGPRSAIDRDSGRRRAGIGIGAGRSFGPGASRLQARARLMPGGRRLGGGGRSPLPPKSPVLPTIPEHDVGIPALPSFVLPEALTVPVVPLPSSGVRAADGGEEDMASW